MPFPANAKHVLFVHDCLVMWFADSEDPISPPGVIHMGLLESAIARPFQTVAGKDAYPSPTDKAGSLFHSLINNHPFHNGNKRTALISTAIYLANCGFWLEKCSDNEMYSFTLAVADHRISRQRKSEVQTISSWLKRHSIKRQMGDSRITHTGGLVGSNDVQRLLDGGRLDISYSVSEIIEFRRIYDAAQNLWEQRGNMLQRLAKT